MKEGLNRLLLAYDMTLKRIRMELNRQLKGYGFVLLFIRRLLIPLIGIELVVYSAIILAICLYYQRRGKNASILMMVEILILIPIIFIYCDWKLCQELFDGKRNLLRFGAILKRIQYYLLSVTI